MVTRPTYKQIGKEITIIILVNGAKHCNNFFNTKPKPKLILSYSSKMTRTTLGR